MSTQPDPMVAAESAVYRQPAPRPSAPPPAASAHPPPSLDHLFDEGFVVYPRWVWNLALLFSVLAGAGLVGMVIAGFASSTSAGLGALAFAAFMLPLILFQQRRLPRSIYAEPTGLRVVWGNGEAGFYSWRRVQPWTPWHTLFGRWVLEIQGGPYDSSIPWVYPSPRLYRLGQLLASAHAADRG